MDKKSFVVNLSAQIAKHLRDVHFGGNWTGVALKEILSDVTWVQATTKVDSLNTIAALVFHMNYYVAAQIRVLQGGSLDAHDKYAFDLPAIKSEEDWRELCGRTFGDAETLAALIETTGTKTVRKLC